MPLCFTSGTQVSIGMVSMSHPQPIYRYTQSKASNGPNYGPGHPSPAFRAVVSDRRTV